MCEDTYAEHKEQQKNEAMFDRFGAKDIGLISGHTNLRAVNRFTKRHNLMIFELMLDKTGNSRELLNAALKANQTVYLKRKTAAFNASDKN